MRMASLEAVVMSTNLEVYFCDLCNESVPQTDLDARRAIRIKGRVIGGCCLPQLPATAASTPAEKRGGGVATALLGVVVLAGLAAAAAFLDWRLSDEAEALTGRLVGLEERARHGQERMAGVEEGIAQLGTRIDLDKITAQFSALESRLDQARATLDLRTTRLDEAIQTSVEGSKNALAEQRGAIALLRESVDRLGGDIAALRAMPRAAPVASMPDEVPPPAALPAAAASEPALPAELQHHVAALADADPGTRFSAVDKLLRSKEQRVLASLLPMAKDDNIFVRRLTVEGLREFRRPETVDTLIVALSDPEPLVRVTAHASLRAVTGQKFEFEDSSSSTRAVAVRRWQDWWDKNRATFAF